MDKLTPEDVRGLKFKCKIEMTTHKNQQQMQVSGQAAALVEKFYTLPPEVQEKVASFYRDQLRALCPTCQVNIVISPMPPLPPPMPGMEAMPNGGNGAAKKPPNGRPTGATAASSTQLIQRSAQPTGVTAPGGTPAG